jgi:type IV pilus assembly protein PilX
MVTLNRTRGRAGRNGCNGRIGRSGGERGFVLVLTLVIIIVITLSSMAMMLLTRAGVTAAGNIAFRQAATRSADIGAESAFGYVRTNEPLLLASGAHAGLPRLDYSNKTEGYYAIHNQVDGSCGTSDSIEGFRATLYDFKDGCASRVSAGDYTLWYVIHRMALAEGECPAVVCASPTVISTTTTTYAGSSQEAGAEFFSSSSNSTNQKTVYYRITIKVAGPRRNNRFVQAFIY